MKREPPAGYEITVRSVVQAKNLIRRCLDVFSKELKGFDAKKAVEQYILVASKQREPIVMPTDPICGGIT